MMAIQIIRGILAGWVGDKVSRELFPFKTLIYKLFEVNSHFRDNKIML